MSRRTQIVTALTEKLKLIDGNSYVSNLFTNVSPILKFWDEVNDFPFVCVVAGDESREYLPADFKWGYLDIAIKIYTKSNNSSEQLESILNDIESILDDNNTLEYNTNKFTTKISIVNISTDQGLLAPFGVGEIIIEVQYVVD